MPLRSLAPPRTSLESYSAPPDPLPGFDVASPLQRDKENWKMDGWVNKERTKMRGKWKWKEKRLLSLDLL